MTRTLSLYLLAILIAASTAPTAARACFCQTKTDAELIDEADAVFVGDVVALELERRWVAPGLPGRDYTVSEEGWHHGGAFTYPYDRNDPTKHAAERIHLLIEVRQVWKGNIERHASVRISTQSCPIRRIQVGERFVILAELASDGLLETAACEGTQSLQTKANDFGRPMLRELGSAPIDYTDELLLEIESSMGDGEFVDRRR